MMDAETQKLLDAIAEYTRTASANTPGLTQAVQLEQAVIDFHANVEQPTDLMMPPVSVTIPAESQPDAPQLPSLEKRRVWLPESGCYYEQ